MLFFTIMGILIIVILYILAYHWRGEGEVKKKITTKERSIYFLVLIFVVILGVYIKSLMYGGNEEI
mgnify:CR=1 FL=1